MFSELSQLIRDEIEEGSQWIADRTSRAARGGAVIGGAIGGALAVILMGIGIIIGRI